MHLTVSSRLLGSTAPAATGNKCLRPGIRPQSEQHQGCSRLFSATQRLVPALHAYSIVPSTYTVTGTEWLVGDFQRYFLQGM
ncbi:hypothetical protein BGZ61DRAFT_98542 [Ilyonectria robusta]|uniref:uncharacterized protein n=1 Tax=Ilyonectria robusta TaxID=1079257 RepID=UPI001E8D1C88|nr:uncharacterized protein BGZ61DRAFT_98542 [Ilyonectria robusta]KAH8675002.1 hypothetical protein BGZ61DRAFT_98542 [Ilyonectria robusta]